MRPSTRLSTMVGRGADDHGQAARQTEAPKLVTSVARRPGLDRDEVPGEGPDAPLRDGQRSGDGHPAAPEQRTGDRSAADDVYRLQKAVRRNKLAFAAAAAIALALTLGAVVSSWQAHRALAANKTATDNLRSARQNLYAAQMNLASQALEDGDARRALDLLDRYQDDKELCGFEWRYLDRLSRGDSLELIQAGATNTRASLAFSPDGKLLAIGGTPRVQLWDMVSHRLLSPLQGHQTTMGDVDFCLMDEILASIDADGEAIFGIRPDQPGDARSRHSAERSHRAPCWTHSGWASFPMAKCSPRRLPEH